MLPSERCRRLVSSPFVQGDPQVLELLNEVLTSELTAINQYFVHAEMCDNWGYQHLHDRIRKHSIGEMKHAERPGGAGTNHWNECISHKRGDFCRRGA